MKNNTVVAEGVVFDEKSGVFKGEDFVQPVAHMQEPEEVYASSFSYCNDDITQKALERLGPAKKSEAGSFNSSFSYCGDD